MTGFWLTTSIGEDASQPTELVDLIGDLHSELSCRLENDGEYLVLTSSILLGEQFLQRQEEGQCFARTRPRLDNQLLTVDKEFVGSFLYGEKLLNPLLLQQESCFVIKHLCGDIVGIGLLVCQSPNSLWIAHIVFGVLLWPQSSAGLVAAVKLIVVFVTRKLCCEKTHLLLTQHALLGWAVCNDERGSW